MATLTAEQILAADDSGALRVEVPEWSGEVYVRVMSVGERDSYERLWLGNRDKGIDNFRETPVHSRAGRRVVAEVGRGDGPAVRRGDEAQPHDGR
jgi:hypothetical protein